MTVNSILVFLGFFQVPIKVNGILLFKSFEERNLCIVISQQTSRLSKGYILLYTVSSERKQQHSVI